MITKVERFLDNGSLISSINTHAEYAKYSSILFPTLKPHHTAKMHFIQEFRLLPNKVLAKPVILTRSRKSEKLPKTCFQ